MNHQHFGATTILDCADIAGSWIWGASMPTDDAGEQSPPTQEAGRTPEKTGALSWLRKFDRWLNVVKGLTLFTVLSSLVTLLSGLIIGYFQYVNAYQEKVRAQAASDMSAAKETFTDISKKFSDAQTLQQLLFRDFAMAAGQNLNGDALRMAVADARAIFQKYEEARLALLKAGELMARNAEIHIDWATEFHDPREPHFPNSDPLTRTLLRDRNFDCDNNLPEYTKPRDSVKENKICLSQRDQVSKWAIGLCPNEKEKGLPVRIDWFSAKHQVLTMHYCFQTLHERLAPARSWASQKDPGVVTASRVELEQMQSAIDNQAARLNAFMGLALFQMETIRQNYQAARYVCHIPLVSSLPFIEGCDPLRTAPFIHAGRPPKS
jgi:hypothetical protein